MDFLRPGTRVWIGENFEIQAVITIVFITRDMTVFYGVDYWDERDLRHIEVERYQFSTSKMTEDALHKMRDVEDHGN